MLFIPTREYHTDMSPTEFEEYSLSLLEQKLANDGFSDYTVTHNVHEDTPDGTYQIDGEIRYSMAGTEMLVLVECKKYTHSVEREKVAVLYDKLRAIGAHKGIFISTSSFQSGALKYAAEHKIALITIVNGEMLYETRSKFPVSAKPKSHKPFGFIVQKSNDGNTVTMSYDTFTGIIKWLYTND